MMMLTASRRLAALLTLAMFAGGVSAGPVQASEVTGPTERVEEAVATLPALSTRPLDEGLAPSPAANRAAPATAAGADAGPSASMLAAEIIKEAEAGAQAAEPPGKAKAHAGGPTAASGPSARTPARTAEGPWGELREIGKAAIQWVKAAVPWLRSDADEGAAEIAVALDSADPLASPLDGGRGAREGTAGASSGLPLDPATTVGYGRGAAPAIPDPGQNLLRMVADVIREVLAHPMTWLVVSLFVIGGIVVKRIDRRPGK